MADGPDLRAFEQRAQHQLKMLDVFKNAVNKLQEIGLTREAAIKNAGQFFDLRLEDSDIAPAASRGRAAQPTNGRRRRRHAKSGQPSKKK